MRQMKVLTTVCFDSMADFLNAFDIHSDTSALTELKATPILPPPVFLGVYWVLRE